MDNNEFFFKLLPEDMVDRYQNGTLNDEEKFIVESLAGKYDNPFFYPWLNTSIKEKTSLPYASLAGKGHLEPLPGELWESVRTFITPDKSVEPLPEAQLFYVLTAPEQIVASDDDYENPGNSVLALPVVPDIKWNTQWDICFLENNNYLGIPFMIMTEMPVEVPVAALNRKITRLSSDDSAKIYNLHYKTMNLEYDPVLLSETLTGIYLDPEDQNDDRTEFRLLTAELLRFFEEVREICATGPQEQVPENIISLNDWRSHLAVPQQSIAAAGNTSFSPETSEPAKSETICAQDNFIFRLELFPNGQVYMNYNTFVEMQNPAIVTLADRIIEFSPKKGFQFKQVLTDLRTDQVRVTIRSGGELLFSGVLKIT